jgi:hypothetical protein
VLCSGAVSLHRAAGVVAESLVTPNDVPQVKKAQQVVQVEAVKVQKELAACVPVRCRLTMCPSADSPFHSFTAPSSTATPATSW